MITMYHPPRCPTCDQELASVGEREESTFRFNEAAGFYEADMRADLMEAKCPNCNADVSQLFEDGVYNYQAPKVEDQPNYQAPNYGVEKPREAPAFP
jgi:hypothetical protein